MTQQLSHLLGGILLSLASIMFEEASSSSSSSSSSSPEPVNFYALPGIHRHSYSQLGDINVGALINTDYAQADGCKQTIRKSMIVVEQTEAVHFAVDYVNRSPDILPNVTLGFVIQGICMFRGPALASSLLFIPRNNDVVEKSSRNGSSVLCSDTNNMTSYQEHRYLGHDVIGVMSTGHSLISIPVSSLYSVAHLPFIGPTETDDELSSKRSHPYFFRISPPQAYQTKATLEFIRAHGWSYISVLYDDFGYTITPLVDNIEKYGICIATMVQLTKTTNYDDVVRELLLYPRARAVVADIDSSALKMLSKSIIALNATGRFIWIGSNLLEGYAGMDTDDLENDPGVGVVFFDSYSKPIPSFFDHLSNVDPLKSHNPWMKTNWEYLFDCSFDEGTCEPHSDILQSSKYRSYKGTPLRADAILTLAHAAHDLLAERCPDARGREARACITGELLREYLKKTSFEGFVNPIKFDENQDVMGRFTIKQIVYDHPSFGTSSNTTTNKLLKKQVFSKVFGTYDISTGKFAYVDKLSWDHLKKVERIVPWTPAQPPIEIPESVCSGPCLPGEYRIQKESVCCWECRTCRENERFINGNTSCEACPSFTWPDPASGMTTCTDLPLTYSTLPDVIPTVLTSFGLAGIAVTVSITIAYVFYRDEKVIKASSRELSVIQLVAIFIGYSTVVLFQTAPSDAMCATIFFVFCMSFSMLYCPLLAKTSRIFRIFKSSAKNERPRYISPQSQLFFSLLLIAIQITLCVATYILYTPKALRIQPVWTEKLVELSCDLTLPGLASFLGYNIVLVSVCSVFAFLTRTLPDNFNESKFISMCVSTTLLIWLAFIPTYFTASREFVRVFLLSVALLLNHTVALLFLFLPKIYAAVFLPSAEGHVSQKASH